MDFRFPLLFALAATLVLSCKPDPTDGKGDTDVADTDVADTDAGDTDTADTDTVVVDTDVEDTDPEVCDSGTDTDIDACTDCVACAATQSCGAEYAACQADVECTALFACVLGCGRDESCYAACKSNHPDGQALVGPLQSCAVAACPNTCIPEPAPG